MTDKELFQYLRRKNDYKTAGLDVQYKVEVNDAEKKVYLFFEESLSKQDWLINLNFPAKAYKEQENTFYVHKGFIKSWKSCNNLILSKYITECIKHPDYQTYICGWSYGGAMSLMAAEDFNYRTNKKANVITFGAPKILYFKKSVKHWKESCNTIKQYTRINDFVTWCVPLPVVHHVNQIKLQEKFNLIKLFNTAQMHCNYDELF